MLVEEQDRPALSYYLCYNRECPSNRKSIPRDEVESAFEHLLQRLQPSQKLFNLAHAIFKKLWDQRAEQATGNAKQLTKEAKKLETEVENLVDRIVDASSDAVVRAYEKQHRRAGRKPYPDRGKTGARRGAAGKFRGSVRTRHAGTRKSLEYIQKWPIRRQANHRQNGLCRPSDLPPETGFSNPKNHLAFQYVRADFRLVNLKWRARQDSNLRPQD